MAVAGMTALVLYFGSPILTGTSRRARGSVNASHFRKPPGRYRAAQQVNASGEGDILHHDVARRRQF
jgi:hypothetical protein